MLGDTFLNFGNKILVSVGENFYKLTLE